MLGRPWAGPLSPESNLKSVSQWEELQPGHTEAVKALKLTCNSLAFPAQSDSDVIYK